MKSSIVIKRSSQGIKWDICVDRNSLRIMGIEGKAIIQSFVKGRL